MKRVTRLLGLGLTVVSLSQPLAGCEVLGAVAEGMGSYAADENAKRQDDSAAYAACDKAYNVCKANGGFGTTPCEEQRSILRDEDIYCMKVGVATGSRAR